MTLQERIEKVKGQFEWGGLPPKSLHEVLDILSDMAAEIDGAVSCNEPEPVKPKTRGQEVAARVFDDRHDRGLIPIDLPVTVASLIDAEIAREREACAKLAETWDEWTNKSYATVSDEIAAAIRARGQVTP